MNDRKKKIIIAAEIFPPDVGGPATYGLEIAGDFARRGYDVNVLCYGEPGAADKNFPFAIKRVSRKKNIVFRYIEYCWWLLKLIQKSDVTYAQGPIASGIPAYLVSNLTGKKYAVKVVGDYAWEKAKNDGVTDVGIDEFQNQKFSGKIGLLKYLEGLVVRNAQTVIVPSEYLKKIVAGWGGDEKKIAVIYNSFSQEMHPREKSKFPHTIVSVGRLVPWKGFDTLIEIMPELLKENRDFKLEILGEGPQLAYLQGLIKKHQLESSVSISCMKREQIVSHLAQVGMFVLNTGYEGLSHTILEALAAGVPVVTTRVGGNPELIEHEQNGMLVEYNNRQELKDAILKIHNDPSIEKKFLGHSKTVLEKFGFERMTDQTLKIMNQL